MTAMLLVIDNYDSFTWNLVHYFGELGAVPEVVRNDRITAEEALARQPEAIVLSPGPCTPNEAGICLELIGKAAGSVPILGVCLGHQAIGQYFGGKVVRAPTLMHGKTSPILHDGSGVFADLPSPFTATRYHSLAIVPETVPADLVVTSATEGGVIMGIADRTAPILGVQFHPEAVLTEGGHRLLGNWLESVGVTDAAARGAALQPRR